MFLYFKQLKLVDKKQLCFNAISIHQNFTNTIHIGKDSNQSPASKKAIYDADKINDKISTQVLIYVYIQNIWKLNDRKLPKNTICCWTLRYNHPDVVHY